MSGKGLGSNGGCGSLWGCDGEVGAAASSAARRGRSEVSRGRSGREGTAAASAIQRWGAGGVGRALGGVGGGASAQRGGEAGIVEILFSENIFFY